MLSVFVSKMPDITDYAPGHREDNAATCPPVCLSHVHSSKTVHFSAMVTRHTEHCETSCCRSNSVVNKKPNRRIVSLQQREIVYNAKFKFSRTYAYSGSIVL